MNKVRGVPKLFVILIVMALVFVAIPASPPPAVAPAHTDASDIASKTLNNALAHAAMLAKAEPKNESLAKPTSIKLDAKKLLFGKIGDTLTLSATVKPSNAKVSDLKFTSSDKSIATVNKAGKVTAKNWGECTITATVGNKTTTTAVQVAKKWVAITFDDGPSAYTNKLLKAMKKRAINSTFFVVGAQAASASRQKILTRAAKAGNEIANHTYAHNGTAGALIKGLKKTDKIIKKATGSESTLMRPPGGGVNKVTKTCGKPIILWSVDPRDWESRNTAKVYKYIKKHTKSGSIVLLHDSHSTSVAAAIKLFDSLDKKGYAFVTVTQLLNSPKANKLYYSGSSKVRTQKM